MLCTAQALASPAPTLAPPCTHAHKATHLEPRPAAGLERVEEAVLFRNGFQAGRCVAQPRLACPDHAGQPQLVRVEEGVQLGMGMVMTGQRVSALRPIFMSNHMQP